MVLGNTTEFARASRLVLDTVSFDRDTNVSVFEVCTHVVGVSHALSDVQTNIRVLGGLLSAHLLAEDLLGPDAKRACITVLLVNECV